MKKSFMAVAFTLSAFVSCSQPTLQQVWPMGYPLSYLNWFDDGTYTIDSFGIWGIVYKNDFSAGCIIGDSGQLLLQSNGCKIANKVGTTIENGDSLVEDKFYDDYGLGGLSITQGVVSLPRTTTTWWVFNMSFSDPAWQAVQNGNPTVLSPDRLYAAIVDVTANNGAGKVLQKKIPVYQGIMGDCRLTACRHANGRDWWLVNHGYNNNCFNKWLVTPDSIYERVEDCVGTLHQEVDIFGMAQFFANGTKYAMGSGNGLVNILDFDRCSGEFSNLKTINNYNEPPYSSTSVSQVSGLCVSPNGRYIYLSTNKYMTQHDLLADSIENTRTLIGKKDSTYSNPSPFYTMALSPHNTIVVSNFQGTFSSPYHVIKYPDSAGLACGFQKEAIAIPGSYDNYTLPNLVNLRLGADSTSLCDTIVLGAKGAGRGASAAAVRVFPNPATEVVFIEVENNRYFSGTLTIVNQLGQTVYENKKYDGATAIKVSGWAAGVYYYHLKNKGHEQSGKVVVGR